MIWLPALTVLPYLILFLWIYRSLRNTRSFDAQAPGSTFVSVIVACRNEELTLPLLLRDLEDQDYPPDLFEVVIVDDNSSDLTSAVVGQGSFKLNLKLIRNRARGKKEAIMTGVLNSSAELIVTTDADCRMGRAWLRTIATFYEQERADMIICPVQIFPAKGFQQKFQELEFLGLQAVTAGTALAGNATMCNGANLAFTKTAYLRNSGNLRFDINSGDDIFLLHSIKREKGSLIAWLESSEVIVKTDPERRVGALLKQRRRWISKSTGYHDRFTIMIGIVTFVTITAQGLLMIASIARPSFLLSFVAVLLLKSVSDWLLIRSAAGRYNSLGLLVWFFPVQLLYPFYVFAVLLWPGLDGAKRSSSPFQRGT